MTPKRVAFLFVCINPLYWQYARQIIEDCRARLLPGHKVDFLLWSDLPEDIPLGAKLFPTPSIAWPQGTLFRYHFFLKQEEILKKYDYLFYLDVDMRIVDVVGDEIMGEGLTMAEHPMYALAKQFYPPYEPNPESEAYIPRLSVTLDEGGKKRLKPLYAAGGFQGGKTEPFIKAMKVMKERIDKDFQKNYIAIWNDESHWNKYLFEYVTNNEGHLTVLPPAYVYPDSLINEYYVPIWGQNYPPKIVTLTKPFTLQKDGAKDAIAFAQQMQKIKS